MFFQSFAFNNSAAAAEKAGAAGLDPVAMHMCHRLRLKLLSIYFRLEHRKHCSFIFPTAGAFIRSLTGSSGGSAAKTPSNS
jgi:hypothetical protein